jgi:hypothetical protein
VTSEYRGDANRSERQDAATRIVVVGPCASGKTTLVQALRERGYDAHVCGQEHSDIAALWQRLGPDVLVALEADVDAIRRRRGASWPEWLHDLQTKRLRAAAAAADLTIDTSRRDPQAMIDQVVLFLRERAAG